MNKILNEIEKLVIEYYSKQKDDKRSLPSNTVNLSEPFFDSNEAINGIRTILEGWISQGPNVQKFESNYASYIGSKYGIAVNSGSSANLVSLEALKKVYSIPNGSEVIIPAATFATVAMPIIQLGLVPVYVDIDRRSLNIDPVQVEAAITDKTRILMPVHTLGYPAPMPELMKIANKYDLIVFEDCCEAHGSSIDGQKVGSFGHIAAFSFFVAHNMTTGEGGMIVTNDSSLDENCRSIREFGRSNQKDLENGRFYSDDILKDYDKRYVFSQIGYNVRMTDIAAGFGLAQLDKLDDMNNGRRENAKWLQKALSEKWSNLFEFQGGHHNFFHTYYTFPILLSENFPHTRRVFCEYLEGNSIETRPLMAGCLPDQPAFRGQPGRVEGVLPVSRYIRDRLVFVGIHPGLRKAQLQHIVDTINSFFNDFK